MKLAEEAMCCRVQGSAVQARRLFEQACERETAAAAEYAAGPNDEPTRSVLYLGAASLARECGRLSEAEGLANEALAGNPPSDIRTDVEKLLKEVCERRGLRVVGDTRALRAVRHASGSSRRPSTSAARVDASAMLAELQRTLGEFRTMTAQVIASSELQGSARVAAFVQTLLTVECRKTTKWLIEQCLRLDHVVHVGRDVTSRQHFWQLMVSLRGVLLDVLAFLTEVSQFQQADVLCRAKPATLERAVRQIGRLLHDVPIAHDLADEANRISWEAVAALGAEKDIPVERPLRGVARGAGSDR